MRDLGCFIKLKRKEKGLSQAGLACDMGSKVDTDLNIENGKDIQSDKTIEKLAGALAFSESEYNECIDIAKSLRPKRELFRMKYVLKSSERILSRKFNGNIDEL